MSDPRTDAATVDPPIRRIPDEDLFASLGGHSHADCLSFQLHAFGCPLAIDSGIGRTYDAPNHAPDHSTATIGVLLFPFDADSPPIRFTSHGNRFIVGHGPRTDELTFAARGVELRTSSTGRT